MRRFAFILASAATLAACEPSEPATADTLGLHIVMPFEPIPGFDADAFRGEIADMLGVDVVTSEHPRGSYTLFLDSCTRSRGHAVGGDTCQRMARSCYDAESAAHELGHLSRLEHVTDRGNLMHGSVAGEGYDLTDDQTAMLRIELAKSINECDPLWARNLPGPL